MQSRIYWLKLSICSAFWAVSMSNETCFCIRIDTSEKVFLCIGVDRYGEKIGKPKCDNMERIHNKRDNTLCSNREPYRHARFQCFCDHCVGQKIAQRIGDDIHKPASSGRTHGQRIERDFRIDNDWI